MENSTKKYRIDELLVINNLCTSRSQAKQLILEGKILLDGTPITKPSKTLPQDAKLTLTTPPRFVARSGEKLAAFLEKFNISVNNLNALDIGASTGGFTDCLIQKEVHSVTCVDVGHGQLHEKILTNTKVTNLEKTNARDLSPSQLPHSEYDIIVVDVSFISLTKILPTLWPLLKKSGYLIALIKPQFEATKEEISKSKGILKDPNIHTRILSEIQAFIESEFPNNSPIGTIESPILGGDGNKEFLIGLTKN